MRIVAAASGVAAVALVGYQILVGGSGTGPGPALTGAASPSQAARPEPSWPMLPELSLPTYGQMDRAGDYGWTGGLGAYSGMHSVVPEEGDEARQTQIVFGVENDCFDDGDGPAPVPVTVAGFTGWYVEPFVSEDPRRVLFIRLGGETTGAYALAIADRTLCVYLSWDPTTTQGELAAARAVIDSIRAQPIHGTGIRIVFTLPNGGWDTG
jgi:hypothetical protein